MIVYVSCESPHGMLLLCTIWWYQPKGPLPLSRTGACNGSFYHSFVDLESREATYIYTSPAQDGGGSPPMGHWQHITLSTHDGDTNE